MNKFSMPMDLWIKPKEINYLSPFLKKGGRAFIEQRILRSYLVPLLRD